jgi:HKD family nuclease
MPDNAGEPVGCITTTFTFQADFFEEECLPRFLGMESNEEDGVVYLVEREEKLNCVDCVAVWVDQSYAKQVRNMRWDLIPFRLRQGILHAKITFLRWTGHLRILVASANATDSGYRKNREIMISLDFNEDNFQDKQTALTLLKSMKEWLDLDIVCSDAVKARSYQFLQANINFLEGLSSVPENTRNQEYFTFPVIVQGGKPSFFEQVTSIWKQHIGDVGPTYSHLVTPFFDPGTDTNVPTERLWDIMKKKGAIEQYVYTSGEKDLNGKPLNIHAPESVFKTIPQNRSGAEIYFILIDPFSKDDKAFRPLHAKLYWFENDKEEYIFVAGSSNFTSKGLGIRTGNIEANLAIVGAHHRAPELFDALNKAWLTGDDVDAEKIKWAPLLEEETDLLVVETPLPSFFQSATIQRDSLESLFLELTFESQEGPEDFVIYLVKGDTQIQM